MYDIRINLYIFGAKLIFLNEMKNNLLKSIYPHLIAITAFLAILFIYYYPVLLGKKLIQNDVIQTQGAFKESVTYLETEKEVLWSNSSFGGMPVWRGYTSNVLLHTYRFFGKILPAPILAGFIAFVGFYILMLAFGSNAWLCFIFSAAFTFSSFNIISLEAGHVNKVLSMAMMAPVLGGVILTYRKKYLAGIFISTISFAGQIFFGHFQVTYYLLIILFGLVIYEFINALRNKEIKHFFIASALLILSGLIAVGPNISQLWTTQVYSKSTTRGGSELTSKKTDSGGLDFDYAMSWSNCVDEVMTILIPYYYGGSSNESLSQNSETYQALISNNVPKADARNFIKNIPLYWGNQPFTSGPVYFGSIIFFLFILGLFLVKDQFKWWVLAVSLFALLISMGKNMEFVSKLLFYNLPLYNKFRSVTMAVCIAQVLFPFLAGVALVKISKKEISKDDFIKGLKWAAGITGFILVFGLFASFSSDYIAESDAQLKQLPEWAIDAIRADRATSLRGDILRAFFFIVSSACLLWAFVYEKIKPIVFYIALALLVLIDLTSVDKRYLNADNFKNQKAIERDAFAATAADEMILQDKDYYRVFNLTKNPFNDASTSFYHKSIGGYSAIKLGKYQDLIENQLSKNNMGVLNMLNTKYFIVPDQKTKEPVVQRNPEAMGNAWFVHNYKIVANADEEMKSLDSINPANTVYIDKRYENQLTNFNIQFDSSASIKLTDYHPDRLKYKSKASSEQLAVFSEIYYQPGWNAYIDTKPVDHFRANYILRAMKIPAGEHILEFKFEPAHYYTGEKISYIFSIVLVLSCLGLLIAVILKYKKNTTESNNSNYLK